MTSLPFIPAITEIVPYIKNKSSLPLMPGMQRTGPLVKKQGDINSNTLNSMAQDLVLKQRVSQNPNNNKLFNVLDLGDNYHGVQLKDRDLSKQNYSCSCSAKDCVHLRAVFLFLNIPPEDIPFIASKDPLQILKRQRNKNKNETSAGKKKPRKGETTKDYRSDDDEHDDDVRSDDDVIRNDDIIKAFDSPDFSTKRKDNKMNKKSSSQSSKNIDERQFQMPAWQKDSKQKAVKEKEEDRSATNLEFDEIQANMNTIENRTSCRNKTKVRFQNFIS
uniref:SWIM-type domain-containing protein n=1 Tax=Panagrolaimus superbus TaxID=310955 RepID=A0A914YLC1_9BILA